MRFSALQSKFDLENNPNAGGATDIIAPNTYLASKWSVGTATQVFFIRNTEKVLGGLKLFIVRNFSFFRPRRATIQI